MVLVLGVREGCVTISEIVVERADLYPYQVTVLSVPLENRCAGSRNVTVEANPSGRFQIIDGPLLNLELDKTKNVTFVFYPLPSVAGTTHIPVVALDLTEDDAIMTGAKANIYVANPFRQWWYIAAALVLVWIYMKQQMLVGQFYPSPIPLTIGAWFIYRGYYLITRHDLFELLLADGGAIPADAVAYIELLLLGSVLIVFGRELVHAFRGQPLALIITVFIFSQLFPAGLVLPDGVMDAWVSRSPAALTDGLLLVLSLPAFVLREVFRLYPAYGLHSAIPIILAFPFTFLYWRFILENTRGRIEHKGGGWAGTLSVLDLNGSAQDRDA